VLLVAPRAPPRYCCRPRWCMLDPMGSPHTSPNQTGCVAPCPQVAYHAGHGQCMLDPIRSTHTSPNQVGSHRTARPWPTQAGSNRSLHMSTNQAGCIAPCVCVADPPSPDQRRQDPIRSADTSTNQAGCIGPFRRIENGRRPSNR
jgi:hypothetical protein